MSKSLGPSDPIVLIVDDDEGVRLALEELLRSVGLRVSSFASTRELLNTPLLDSAGCLVLDVRMPGGSGLDLQAVLASSGVVKPIIFLTGHGDIPMSVKAIKGGASDFLTKPFRDQTLLDAVTAAIELDAANRVQAHNVNLQIERFALLTPRERQVIYQVVKGRLNKQITYDLGISEITVKLHRSNGMRKMQIASIGQLIRSWETLPEDVRLNFRSKP